MSNKKYIILYGFLSITLIGLISFFEPTIQFIVCIVITCVITYSIFKSDKKFEKLIIFSFFICIPFEKDFVLFNTKDYHSVTQPFFQLNILYFFIPYFIIRIFKLRNKIKLDKDFLLVSFFVLLSFFSMFWALNPFAAFYDAVRYLFIFIIYIYFSRCINVNEYIRIISYSLLISLSIQLAFGLLQILLNGPIGISFLGESSRVFREGMVGYEKGISGTFGHPGPIAIYSVFLLSWILYLDGINKTVKNSIILVASLIILLAAGRTSILLLIAIFIIYVLDRKKLNIKALIVSTFSFVILLISLSIFQNGFFERVFERFTRSDTAHQLDSRLYHWELAINYIQEKPILGWGLNNYLDITYSQFPLTFHQDFFLSNPIHNLYLLYGVELGLIGLIIFAILIVKNFYYVYKIRKNKSTVENYLFLKGFIISIILYCIYNMQGWAGVKTRILILFWVASAIIYNIYNKSNKFEHKH